MLKIATNNEILIDGMRKGFERTGLGVMQLRDGTRVYEVKTGRQVATKARRYLLSAATVPSGDIASLADFEQEIREIMGIG